MPLRKNSISDGDIVVVAIDIGDFGKNSALECLAGDCEGSESASVAAWCGFEHCYALCAWLCGHFAIGGTESG